MIVRRFISYEICDLLSLPAPEASATALLVCVCQSLHQKRSDRDFTSVCIALIRRKCIVFIIFVMTCSTQWLQNFHLVPYKIELLIIYAAQVWPCRLSTWIRRTEAIVTYFLDRGNTIHCYRPVLDCHPATDLSSGRFSCMQSRWPPQDTANVCLGYRFPTVSYAGSAGRPAAAWFGSPYLSRMSIRDPASARPIAPYPL